MRSGRYYLLFMSICLLASGTVEADARTATPPIQQASRADMPVADLDRFVGEIMRAGEIPGAAVAIVRDGHVVAVRGYGVRELGRPEPVDADTIFDAASLTKSFTAAAVATLVDEGRMGWDDPVRRHLPAMEFPDPYLTEAVTMRDLLSHRTGLAPTNSAWYFPRLTRPQLLQLVRHMELAAPFRTRWIYSNIGYTIAGEAAAAAAGEPWDAMIAHRLLVPLGMTRTTADFDAAPAMGNLATPHDIIDGVQRPIPRETTRMSTAPAGGVQSSARDLATWLLFQLGDGSFNGRRILAAGQLAEMHAPQIVVPTSAAFRAERQLHYYAAYALGWQVFDYRGRPMLWHSGGGDGQRAYMAMLPDQNIGVVVLFNTKAVAAPAMLYVAERVFDHYLGDAPRPYVDLLETAMQQRRQRRLEARAAAARPGNTSPPSAPLESFTGMYRDRLGLDTRITLDAGRLRLTYGGGESATLEHRGHDVFIAHWANRWHDEDLAMPVSFSFDENGRVVRLNMRPFDDEVAAVRVDPPADRVR